MQDTFHHSDRQSRDRGRFTRIISLDQQAAVLRLHAAGHRSRAISADVGISRESVSKIIREDAGR